MRKFIPTITRYLLITGCLYSTGLAKNDNPSSLAKPATVEFELFSSNNISNWIGNQGHLSSHIPTGDAGGSWPTGSGKRTVFASGIWVIGQMDGEIRSAASEYITEWSPGTIPYNTQTQLPTSGSPDNTADHQIYLIGEGDSSDPNSEDYNREFATWPASDGAPSHDGELFSDLNQNGIREIDENFEDFNNDGTYNPPDGNLVTGSDPPRFIGDEMTWYVMNDWDTTAHHRLWNSAPMGIEAHVLVYTLSDEPLYENVQFNQITLVNKGGDQIDSCYYSYWSDPDIGDANNDAVGCEPQLSLGYAYNNHYSDRSYGLQPPAVGYTILQGPLVTSIGDTVWQDDSYAPDQASLDMTSYIFFVGSDNRFGDPKNEIEAYYNMQGLNKDGTLYQDPWGIETVFLQSGDPVEHTGWTGIDFRASGDRRFMANTGPFDMAPWDDSNDNGQADFGEPGVQIVHGALIIVDGADHLDAITNLKHVSRYVQQDFDYGFEDFVMPSPQFTANAEDGEIILNWFEGATGYEAMSFGPYAFEGYNIYQGASEDGPWTNIATYDIVNRLGNIYDQAYNESGYLETQVVQEATDSGLEHLLSIGNDQLNDASPLVNNRLYHFALSAYAYPSAALPSWNDHDEVAVTIPIIISSEKRIVSIRPHVNYMGINPRDTLAILQRGDSELSITIDVMDPSHITGLDYEIGFEYDSTTSLGRWYLLRTGTSSQDTLHKSVWFGQWNARWRQWLVDFGHEYVPFKYYFDGFELSVDDISFQAPKYNRSWLQTVNPIKDSTWVTSYPAVSPGGVDSLMIVEGDTISLIDFFGPLEHHWDTYEYYVREEGTLTWFDIPFKETRSVIIRSFTSSFGGQGGDRIADIPGIGGGSNDLEFLQADLELRFTEAGQYASLYSADAGYNPVLIHIPYEIWDTERNIQLCIGINDINRSGGNQDTTLDDWQYTLDMDWVIVFDRDYASYGSQVDSLFNNPHSGWGWQFNRESRFSNGDVISIQFLNPVIAGIDVYSWSTEMAGTAYDQDALDQIQIFPNPYFGYQPEQSSFSKPYVTLSNLPEQECIIRIYSLGGQLVRRFDHEVGTYEYWDLLNDHGSPIASGMYIVHIEVPDLGNKILKAAVFQPER
jgi:hypothetical protein